MSDLKLMFVGDLVLDGPDCAALFGNAAPTLRAADLTIGHVEIPHTLRGEQTVFHSPAPSVSPEQLSGLRDAGFAVCTLAGNHMFDRGRAGIEDTLSALHEQGVVTAGAGFDISEARMPAIVERKGRRIATLSYNCVGTRESWATPAKPGCAYVRVLTHYELDYANPGGPPEVFTFATPASLEAMRADISSARENADLVVVALHKGLVHTPASLADYEREISRKAIEAGADIVIGHHAHILQGVEIYRGKPIFHGLGNFVTVTPALEIEGNPNADALAWAKRRRALFGFVPDPDCPTYPFHPSLVIR